MTFKTITTADKETYPFAEQLFIEAFPANERRDLPQQRFNVDHEPRFSCNLLIQEDKAIGILTIWNLGCFLYIEHFAISPSERNKGYGHQALDLLKRQSNLVKKPIVLEVERPTDSTAIRRIQFYERSGFTMDEHDYIQPPYREGDEPFPMRIMTYGRNEEALSYEYIATTIHKEIYGQRQDMSSL